MYKYIWKQYDERGSIYIHGVFIIETNGPIQNKMNKCKKINKKKEKIELQLEKHILAFVIRGEPTDNE